MTNALNRGPDLLTPYFRIQNAPRFQFHVLALDNPGTGTGGKDNQFTRYGKPPFENAADGDKRGPGFCHDHTCLGDNNVIAHKGTLDRAIDNQLPLEGYRAIDGQSFFDDGQFL